MSIAIHDKQVHTAVPVRDSTLGIVGLIGLIWTAFIGVWFVALW